MGKRVMTVVYGCVLLLAAGAMLFVERPARGSDVVPWLAGAWILGQMYVLLVLVIGVVGASLILTNWPG
jgi:hypothetical protein